MKLSRYGYLLAAVLLIGLGLRLLFFLQYSATPFYRHPLLDCAYYHQMAQNVARGDLVQERAFFLGPLYSYLLGIFYAVLGAHPWVAPILQLVLGLATCLLIYRLAARLFSPTAGIVAALLYAVCKPVLFYEQTLLMETTLACVCLLLLTLVVEKGEDEDPRWWLAIGALLGIAALFRGNVLLFLPVLALWLYAKRAPATRRAPARRALGPRLALLAAGTFLAILPATLHNYLAERDLVWISSNDGINLFIGNNERASGAFEPPPGVEMGSDMPGIKFAERAFGRSPIKSSQASAFWRSRALEFMAASPLRALGLAARKAYYFWGAVELDQVFIVGKMATLMPVLHWPLFTFRLLGPLSLLGLAAAFRRKEPRSRVLIWFIVAYIVSLLPFFMTSRYRLPVVPLLCVFAALALVHGYDFIRRRNWRKVALYGLSVLALLFLLENSWALPKRQLEETFHNSLGVIYLSERNFDLALREFQTAAREGGASEIYGNLAWVYFLKKDFPNAIHSYEQAYQLNPNNAETCFRLGLAHLMLRHLPEARTYMEKSISLDPRGDPLCYYNLAVVYAEQKEPALAERAMRAYLARVPNDRAALEMLEQYRRMSAP